jgi:hypothetical protein
MMELLNADAGPARWMECSEKVADAWRRNGSRMANSLREQGIAYDMVTLGCRPRQTVAMAAEASFRRSIAFRSSRRNGQPLHFVVRFRKRFGTDWQKSGLFIGAGLL